MNLKLFGKNTIIYGIAVAISRAASFLLIPIYTHFLSISEYGSLVTLLLTIEIMVILVGLGTRNGLIRFASEYEGKNLMGCLLGSSILINIAGGLILASVSMLLLKPFFRSIMQTDQVSQYIVLICGVAISKCLWEHILSYYRARNDASQFIAACLPTLLLLVILTLVFLPILHQGVKGVLMAQIITYAGVFLFVLLKVFSKIGIGISMQLISKLLRFSLPLVLVMSGNLITDTSAMYFLSYFRGLEDVAIYSLGYKVAQISSMVFILPFQLAYEPFVYANIDTPDIRSTIAKLLTYLMIGFSFVALGIVFISRTLLPFIAPPEYSSAYLIVFLTLPGMAFRGINYFGQSLLHVKNKTYVTGIVVVLFTILSVILNYLLISIYGIYGVVFVFNFMYISTALLLMILGMKTFPIPLEGKRLGISGALLFSFLLLVFFLHQTEAYIYYSIIPIVTCATIILFYFLGFFDQKEKLFIRSILHGMRLPITP